jgi:hypothetical protein
MKTNIMDLGVMRNDERTRREERAASMIAEHTEVGGTRSAKNKKRVCRLKKLLTGPDQ